MNWKDNVMTHLVKPSVFIPQTVRYTVEGRNPDTGWTDATIPLPFNSATAAALCTHYFKNNPHNGRTVTLQMIAEWYNSKGIYFRPKT